MNRFNKVLLLLILSGLLCGATASLVSETRIGSYSLDYLKLNDQLVLKCDNTKLSIKIADVAGLRAVVISDDKRVNLGFSLDAAGLIKTRSASVCSEDKQLGYYVDTKGDGPFEYYYDTVSHKKYKVTLSEVKE